MGKKKTSSEDFLNLLEDQESAPETMAFDPKKKSDPEAKIRSAPKKVSLKIAGYELGPVQQELVEFVWKKTPKVVTDWASSQQAKHMIERVEESFHRVQQMLRGFRRQK